ncbi:hypothetical protein E2C01_051008 [Portunus trituberculatus]|uniref:Uncharacterized protein n=1 Tax=Portunus trituberculatus TaxID=210409 RepID=A0A5B7GHL7_PORTR|nr:hypothetical protein [Portunus trituberculatus]
MVEAGLDLEEKSKVHFVHADCVKVQYQLHFVSATASFLCPPSFFGRISLATWIPWEHKPASH